VINMSADSLWISAADAARMPGVTRATLYSSAGETIDGEGRLGELQYREGHDDRRPTNDEVMISTL
jgi:hypothetical protein